MSKRITRDEVRDSVMCPKCYVGVGVACLFAPKTGSRRGSVYRKANHQERVDLALHRREEL